MNFKRALLVYFGIAVLAVVGIYLTYPATDGLPAEMIYLDFISVPLALLFAGIFIAVFHLFDSNFMKSINTIHELKKGNIAYALFLVSIAIVLHAVATILSG